MYKNYYSEINVSANVYKLHFSAISLEFGCSFQYLEIQNTVIEQQLLLLYLVSKYLDAIGQSHLTWRSIKRYIDP